MDAGHMSRLSQLQFKLKLISMDVAFRALLKEQHLARLGASGSAWIATLVGWERVCSL